MSQFQGQLSLQRWWTIREKCGSLQGGAINAIAILTTYVDTRGVERDAAVFRDLLRYFNLVGCLLFIQAAGKNRFDLLITRNVSSGLVS